jgi:hypothetical protein
VADQARVRVASGRPPRSGCHQDQKTGQYRHLKDLLIGLRGMLLAAKESPKSTPGASA